MVLLFLRWSVRAERIQGLGALLQLVKRLGVVVSDLATVAVADRYRIDEFSALGVIFVRIVGRKKNAIGTHRQHRAMKRLGAEVTARGDPDVVCEIIRQALLRTSSVRAEIDAVLDAPGEER